MAENNALFESYLSCHVCTETFRDPVTLGCNHSFCSSCLELFWKQAQNKNCPICIRKSSKDNVGPNFTLKELADSFVGKLKLRPSETQKEEKEEEEELVCRKHKEKPKLFCKDEQRALCSVCEFSLHQSHNVVPIEQAVSELKDQLESDLESLQDKKKKYREAKETYNKMFQHSQKQLMSTEKQIRAQFNKLQQLLKEEEESRLAALRGEEEQKGKAMAREMKMIEEKLSSLSDSICAVEEELQKHNVSFLSSYKATQSRTRSQCSLSDPQLLSGALIDVAKHLGNLSFRVWDKMKDNITFTPVILDPNTAARWLYLSDDLTSVRRVDTHQQLPDNPERHTKYAAVLGSEGFSSGKHSWEVEVGDLPHWNVGFVKESADRKGKRDVTIKSGLWCLVLYNGKYTDGFGGTVRVKKSLQRIRVQLDYDRGEVSFYNPEDATHIYTHRDTFTEKMFPYFSVGKAADAKSKELKICQAEISL
ncbi:zinc-binding protein A33-like [Genypterus blacodes]|uniref:zinc-binding protein A33-like n=1 Tax=Genypterus blacodes TaxID=154954 RepID=UPI003F758207